MKPHRSFQTHLTVVAAAVSAVILLAFGTEAWFTLRAQWLASVDARILVAAERASRTLHPHANFDTFAGNWEQAWGGDHSALPRALAVLSPLDGHVLYSPDHSAWLTSEMVLPYLPPIEELPDPRPAGRARERERERPERPERPGGPPRERGPNVDGPGPRGGGREPARSAPAMVFPPVARFDLAHPETGKPWRMIIAGNHALAFVAGADLSSFEAELEPARNTFLGTVPLAVAAVALGGWLVARRALRPLKRISETAAHVSASDLAERIPSTGREYTEFGSLVDSLNDMIARLERSFHQATRFTADASHELKTPIALMQAEVESALRACAPGSGTEASLLHIASEIQRLKRITQSLLLLSQVDAGRLVLSPESHDLSAGLASVCEDAGHLCEDASLTFSSDIAPGVTVHADPVLLQQAVQNLLTNAVKYNRPGGSVSLTLTSTPDTATLAFTNTGPGIPVDERARIFDRFYRADPARNRATDGFGLGLNLAAEIVAAHGGTLGLTSGDPDATTFTLSLPCDEK